MMGNLARGAFRIKCHPGSMFWLFMNMQILFVVFHSFPIFQCADSWTVLTKTNLTKILPALGS